MAADNEEGNELDAEMAFIQKKIADGVSRKQKELNERHKEAMDELRREFREKENLLKREHEQAVEKLERDLRDKAKEEQEAMSEKLSSEFAEEFAEQEQKLKAQLTEEKRGIEEDLRRRADSDLARDKRDLEETFQAKIRKREEELKDRLDNDMRSREAEMRRSLDIEYKQRLSEAQSKLDEQLRASMKDLAAAADVEAQKKLESDRARLESEMARKLDAEISRVNVEQRYKLTESETALKERMTQTLDSEKRKIEEDWRVRLLRRGRYSRLSRAIKKPLYPFPAIVGLEKAKRAVILNAINPNVGGVVLWGREGNGKFTLLLSFAEMLSSIEKELVGREEEHKVWNDEERYLTGRIHYGHEMAVYNIDTYLQCAALSLPTPHHRTDQTGQMDLPPLLLSTLKEEDEHAYHLMSGYTLHVEVTSPNSVEERLEIMHRNADFRKDPAEFIHHYSQGVQETVGNIRSAKDRLPQVSISTKILALVARMTILDKQSARLDVLMEQLARTNAAFEGRTDVDSTDVMEAADLALMHKLTPREMSDVERAVPHESSQPRQK